MVLTESNKIMVVIEYITMEVNIIVMGPPIMVNIKDIIIEEEHKFIMVVLKDSW